MRARFSSVALLFITPALLLHGQAAGVVGPVSGYVFDSAAHGLRPILGTPGSSLIGNPIDFGFAVASVAVAPRQDTAFVGAADGTFHLFRITSGTPAPITLNGLTGAAQRVVFSPLGQAAALYSAGSVQIISGLPDSPAIAATVDVSAAGNPAALALSDDGAALLVASANSVQLFGSGASLGQLVPTSGPALLAFVPGQQSAAVADLQGAGIVLAQNLLNGPSTQVLAPSDSTIQSGSALAYSADGSQLLLASSAGQSVTAFDLAAGSRNSLACSCSPSTLTRTGDWFRLNELGRDPLWMLDAKAASQLVFVPAAPASPASEPQRRRPPIIGTPRPIGPIRPGVSPE